MKNLFKGLIVAAVAVAAIAAPSVNAYDQAEYTGNGKPQFNVYTSVLNFGNEKDFLRVGPVGANASQFSNSFNACDGEAQLNVYVHNGAPEGFNGTNNDGTGVAKDTKLNIQIPVGTGKTFNNTAVISAKDVTSVMDGATILCNGEEVKLEYVTGSARIYTKTRNGAVLSDAVVNGGTLIGNQTDDGVVPGCWEDRIYVTLKVKVSKIEKPEVKQPVCDLLEVTKLGGRKVRATLKYTANSGSLKNASINFGDGTVKQGTSAEHTYASDGPFNITSALSFMVDGKEVVVDTSKCSGTVKFTAATTTLPNTGAGDIIGIAAAVTVAGAVAHRYFYSKFTA